MFEYLLCSRPRPLAMCLTGQRFLFLGYDSLPGVFVLRRFVEDSVDVEQLHSKKLFSVPRTVQVVCLKEI